MIHGLSNNQYEKEKTIVTRVGVGYYANKASGTRHKIITFDPNRNQNVTELGQEWHSAKVKRNKREIKKFKHMASRR